MKPLKPFLYDNEANDGNDPFWGRVAEDIRISGYVIDVVYPKVEAPLEDLFQGVIIYEIDAELHDDEDTQ